MPQFEYSFGLSVIYLLKSIEITSKIKRKHDKQVLKNELHQRDRDLRKKLANANCKYLKLYRHICMGFF